MPDRDGAVTAVQTAEVPRTEVPAYYVPAPAALPRLCPALPCPALPALPCKLRVATGQGLLSQAATLHALVKPPFPLRLLRNDGQPWNVQRPDAIIIRARPPTSLQLDILFHQSTPSSDQHTLEQSIVSASSLKPQAFSANHSVKQTTIKNTSAPLYFDISTTASSTAAYPQQTQSPPQLSQWPPSTTCLLSSSALLSCLPAPAHLPAGPCLPCPSLAK